VLADAQPLETMISAMKKEFRSMGLIPWDIEGPRDRHCIRWMR
jgi:hypothetical protein